MKIGELILPVGQKINTTAHSQNPVPLIVTTNENQWSKGQKTLLAYSLFGDVKANKSQPISFERFINFFLPFFIESTRQNTPKEFVIRLLSRSEIEDSSCVFPSMMKRPIFTIERRFFKFEKFQNKQDIKLNDFEAFWEW